MVRPLTGLPPLLLPYFFGDYGEMFLVGDAEGCGHGYVGGVAAGGDEDSADAGVVVAGVEGPPAVFGINLEPGAEVHGIGAGEDTDVSEVAGGITGGNV